MAEVVKKQADAGVDLINDGEMSKPSYATYIKDRLDGFGGTGNTFVYQDLAEFPKLEKRVFGDPGRSRRKTPACNAPISVRDAQAAATDADNLKAALASVKAAGGFMSAASPGVVSLFFRNEHYKRPRDLYLTPSPRRCGTNTRPSPRPASCCRSIAPTSPWAGISNTPILSLPEFRKRAQLHVEALNHALANIPAEQLRMHVCWGNYEGPHHCDVPLADIIDIVFTARPNAISFEAANPRHAHEWTLFETREAAGRQGADPRRDRIEVEFHRASRADRAAHRPLRQTGRARERHRRQRLRLRHLGRPGGGRSRRGVRQARRHGGRRARSRRGSSGNSGCLLPRQRL